MTFEQLWNRIRRRPSIDRTTIRGRLAELTVDAPPPMIPEAPAPPARMEAPIMPSAGTATAVRTARLVRQDGTVVATLECRPACGTLTIGRGTDAQIRIRDEHVSRVHAFITWDESTRSHVLEDAGGPNGTTVDHVRIRPFAHLRDGSRIRVGRTVMFYRS